MRSQWQTIRVVVAWVLGTGSVVISCGGVLGQSPQTGKARAFFAGDYEKKVMGLVQADNRFAWSVPLQAIHDAQALPNGNWMIQNAFTNVQEIDPSGKVVWEYEAGKNDRGEQVEIHAFYRYPDGRTMIAESGWQRLIEVDAQKAIVHTIPLRVDHPHPHRDTRLVRPTRDNTYLVAHEGDGFVREYDRDGKVVWDYDVQSKVYSAVRLENGNTLIGTGDGHSVLEVDRDRKVVWSIREKELPNVQLVWVTMVDRLANGNTWIVNCHAGPKNPQVLEVTPDKKIVWSLLDFDRFGNALPVAVPVDR